MAKTIVGLYDDHSTAKKVLDKLTDQGFDRNNIRVESHSDRRSGSDLLTDLTRHGIPEDDAHFYAEGVRRGGTLVALDVPEDRVHAVSDVMKEHRAVQMERRRERWEKEEGYTGYDPEADYYTEEEAARERQRYADEEASASVAGETSRQTGEVRARTTAEERTEHVHETARERETDIDETGHGERRRAGTVAFADFDEDFRKHHRSTYGEGDYSAYEPAYRYGYEYGTHDEYRDREFSELEPEMRRSYEERHGRGTWDKVKDAVRHAFTRTRSRY